MRRRNLTFKFTLMFAMSTLLTLVISSILSYINQTTLYKQQREESVQFVASHLEELLMADDIYFVWYQQYFLEKGGDFLIPYDFDDASIQESRHKYEDIFAKDFPGLVLAEDIMFDDLSEDAKKWYEIYTHEYYQIAFEKTCERANLSYIYYLVPKNDGTGEGMLVLDSERKERIVNGKNYLKLGTEINYPKEKFEHLWEAWKTGKRPNGYDIFEANGGETFTYYTPLFVGEEKLGVIAVGVEISTVTHGIFMATLRNMLIVGSILILFMFFLLLLIRHNYIRKLVKLQKAIESYSQSKDTQIAEHLKSEVTNKDEISVIMGKFAEMIYELERYMKSLSKTTMDLQNTKKQAKEMSELAIKDSLTGIRNKTGYDKEVQKLEWEISSGLKDFGVAMIDLNFLKRINDTYGHDKGNIAIITLCKIVCHIFEHSPVFRIGGDEFVVILKGHDLEHVDELIAEFNKQLKERQENIELEYWEQTSAAIGYAVYDPKTDVSYDNVFKKADMEMYKAKKAMKAVRED